jgi:AcrR family transcriptional regulator
MAAISARSLAAEAEVAPSAINYNFGSLERLFSSTFERAAQRSAVWAADQRAALAVLPPGPAGAALALEHVIAAWTGEARDLAMLYQEVLAATPAEGPAAAWTAAWRDFWLEAASALGLAESDGRLLHLFFESEALYHLSAWSPVLEPAVLAEMCRHFAAVYLGAPPHPPTGALAAAEVALGVLRQGAVPSSAVKVVEAAADIVEESGLAGLTHRAVAARAGVTTGAVTHHFRTMENLVAGTIRGQVSVMSRSNAPGAPRLSTADQPVSLEKMFEGIRAYVITDRPWGPSLRRRHIFLAALRRPELGASGAVIRFAHGATTSEMLSRLFDMPRGERSLYAGVLSRLVSSSWFAVSGDAAPRDSQRMLIDEVEARLARNLASA